MKAALLWYCDEQGLPRCGTVVSPEWRSLRCRIKDWSQLAKLAGFIRFCSLKGVRPDEVDDETLVSYLRYRAETTALKADTKAHRAIARAWNKQIGVIAGWAKRLLTEPPLKTREGPHWADFPIGIRQDLERYITYLSGKRRSVDGKRLQPCKAITLRTKRSDLVAFAKMAVKSGVIAIEKLTSMRVLLHPDVAKPTLDAYWKAAGEQPGSFTIDMPKKLIAAARALQCLDAAEIEVLEDMRSTLERYRPKGMTRKNRELVRQVLVSGVWADVVRLPAAMMAKARALQGTASLKAAMTAQLAVAIALLTVAPVRIKNLTSIRLTTHLNKPGGPGTPYWLTFEDEEVKNEEDLQFLISASRTALIDEYIQTFRPRLVRGRDDGAIFPGLKVGAKTEHGLSLQIIKRVWDEVGLRITPHQFRHAAVAIWLKHHPGDYETARRILGHRNIRTTIRFYSGLETIWATETFARLIEEDYQNQTALALGG
ncbi:MAG: tyrosine-type recombinase/integrase [Xanthobacteraceae bacterium]